MARSMRSGPLDPPVEFLLDLRRDPVRLGTLREGLRLLKGRHGLVEPHVVCVRPSDAEGHQHAKDEEVRNGGKPQDRRDVMAGSSFP